jgi:hypothetical protein
VCSSFAAGAASADVLGDVRFPLHISADGRRLEDSLGRPFLMNGDAAWSLMVVPTAEEAEAYLEQRRQLGFNTVLVNLIERGFGGPENAEGEPPFIPANDFTAPNEAYFAYADWLIDLAAEKNMLVLLTPAYLGLQCGSQGWCEQMLDQPVSAMTEYGHFLGDRYKNRKNILWVNGGDTNANGHGAIAHVNALANAIRERAPGQIHTGHCSRNNSGIECYDEPWLDINNTYSNCGGSFDATLNDYEIDPIRAFFYIEGSYEGNNATQSCLIDQHVWSVLGGSTGHVFGNDPIWRFGEDWEDALTAPGSIAMSKLSKLFLSRAWFRLEPDLTSEVLISGGGSEAIAARTSDGESVLVYLPDSGTLIIDMTEVAGSSARAWWFTPQNGGVVDLGTFPTTGQRSFNFTGPRVLVLDDAAAGLPMPGSQPYPIESQVEVPLLPPAASLGLALALALGARHAWRLRRRC